MPEALMLQPPLDVGRTWALMLWLLSKTNTQNAVMHRMASPRLSELLPAKKSTLLRVTFPLPLALEKLVTVENGRLDPQWGEAARFLACDGQPESHQLARRVSTDERASSDRSIADERPTSQDLSPLMPNWDYFRIAEGVGVVRRY